MSNDSLRRAVRDLRLALSKTQTEFGAVIGKSLPTIQRYEGLVAPKGKMLLKLERLARESRFDELANVFRDAARADLGLDLPAIETTPVKVPFVAVRGVPMAEPETDDERNLVHALQMLMFRSSWQTAAGDAARNDLRTVRRGLRRALQAVEDLNVGNQPDIERFKATIRQHLSGTPAEEIARRLGISRADVDSNISLYVEGE